MLTATSIVESAVGLNILDRYHNVIYAGHITHTHPLTHILLSMVLKYPDHRLNLQCAKKRGKCGEREGDRERERERERARERVHQRPLAFHCEVQQTP